MKRWYVSMTWHDFPEGGSFGTTVDAEGHDEAVEKCRLEMATHLNDGADYEEDREEDEIEAIEEEKRIQALVDDHKHDWHLIDCWDVDEFIRRHRF